MKPINIESNNLEEFKIIMLTESVKARPIRYKNKMSNLLYSALYVKIMVRLSEQTAKDIYETN